MRNVVIALAVVIALPGVASAQTAAPAAARAGQILRDVNKIRIGVIDRVNPDGSIQVIAGSRFVTIPATQVLVAQDGITTPLTKREVAKLR